MTPIINNDDLVTLSYRLQNTDNLNIQYSNGKQVAAITSVAVRNHTPEPVWQAQITPKALANTSPQPITYFPHITIGSITDDEFAIREAHRFNYVIAIVPSLFLGLSKPVPYDFNLQVGDQNYRASESSENICPFGESYWWHAPEPVLEANQTTTVSVTPVDIDGAQLADRLAAPPQHTPTRHGATVKLRMSFSAPITSSPADTKDHAFKV